MRFKYESYSDFESKYSSAIAYAEILIQKPEFQVHKNHVPIAAILKQDDVKDLIFLATKISQLGPNDTDRQVITIQSVINSFDGLNFGSISRFNPDDFECIDTSSHAVKEFMLKNIIYLLKEKQCACARCGMEIEDRMFGAIGYECDHVEENYRENDQSMKLFKIADAFRKEVDVAINEVTKTQLTCGTCHLRVKYSISKDLPQTLLREYPVIHPRAVTVYLDSDEGINMLDDFSKAWGADKILTLTWQDLQVMMSKFALALEDVAYITEGVWNDGRWEGDREEERQYYVCRIFMNVITCKLGGCLFCKISFSNLLPIQLMGIDFHHIMEAKKKHEPSELAKGSPWRAAQELRKTCALCRGCHAKVTHCKSSASKLMTLFNDEFGYNVDNATGYVI
jgi:hypothetical protein